MNTSNKIILVTGATGQQGGASTHHLRAHSWSVRALSRDPHKPEARALADAGVEVVQGDLNDRASLDLALKGVYGVHSVQSYMPHDPTGEIYQGKTLVDAAKAAGVAHLSIVLPEAPIATPALPNRKVNGRSSSTFGRQGCLRPFYDRRSSWTSLTFPFSAR